jgi:MFS family permease
LILAHLQPLPLLVFYLMTVFTLSWATSDLGYSKGFSINAVVFGIVFRVFIPVSALIADRIGRRKCLLCHNGHRFFWFCLFFFLNSGSPVLVTLLCIGMALMGLLMVLWELSCRNCFLRTFVIQELLWHLIWLESSGSFCAYDCDLAGDSL